MTRIQQEISEHDNLILMMARYFQKLGYTDIRADIPGWVQPSSIFWTNNPDKKYIPDLTCKDNQGKIVILEAETCSTLNTQHTQDQFKIFRAHASNNNGRFEVVVPRVCDDKNTRDTIQQIASTWGITLDNIWTPTS